MFGSYWAWIIPFLLFTLGELVYTVLQIDNADLAKATLQIINFSETNSLSILYLLICGFFTSTVSSHFVKLSISEKIRFQSKIENETQLANSNLKTDTSKITKTQFLTSGGEHSASIGGVDELLASVVYFMRRNFKSFSALGFTFDSGSQCFVLNSFQSKGVNIRKSTKIPVGTGIIGQIGLDKKIFMSGDLSYYTSNSVINYYDSSQEINSILAVPIISEPDELLGVLVLDSTDKNAFKDQDKEILKRFSSLAAALITNARMRIFQEQTARTFQIFYEGSHKLTTALNLTDVFNVMLQIGPSVADCTRQMILLFDEEKRVGRIIRISGKSPDIFEGLEFPIDAGLYSFAFKKRQKVNVHDYQAYQTKYYRFLPDETKDYELRSLIIFPIIDDEGRCRGLYSVESNSPNLFIGEIEKTLETLVENASVAFTRALLYQKMEKLATTDGLTELNNHRHFQELLSKEIERTRRYGTNVSLLLLDIDHFKTFNDTYGHPVGDLVLKEIAACIRHSLRINDLPCRYGGEEFTVIIPESNEQNALFIAERIRTTIEGHVIISLDRKLHVTVSIGVASFPSLSTSQPELIDNADKALYYSKEHGRNRVTIYAHGMGGKK